ncbi:uncharacterized protein cubi_02902 [Cryptosporidium ubiquitum]|uniref:Uncharacterized protein n=1 Tax=Cryptosporidium ubiquitum TaxID=857276 RepID=A0A1J4MM73_9CRYT|nr:uncharacterized protein cubi_02902 [Cryptosporidium ubiquitum]OII74100.1 hypothetical protein cubi_02902 [Cryptosporidium ubiquitum]
MFIIERALNIFTLIYEMEAKISLNESRIPKIGLESSASSFNSALDSSTKRNSLSFNTGFIPNQLVLNSSLLSELRQESFSSSKNIPQNIEEPGKYEGKSEASNYKQYKRKSSESKDLVKSSSKFQANVQKLESEAVNILEKGQAQSIPNLELSKIVSPDSSNIQVRKQNNVAATSSLNNHSQSKHKLNAQERQIESKDRNIQASSPRFVRVNSNLVDNSFNTHRMQNIAKGGAFPAVSPISRVYNNTNIHGTSWRTVWPNSNLMSNGGMGDALASPVSAKSMNKFSPASPQQMFSPTSYNQINSNVKYTVTPNPSVVRYIEQKSAEGLASPVGFSPLASPNYRKNVSQSKSNNSTSTANSNLNNLTFSYKG